MPDAARPLARRAVLRESDADASDGAADEAVVVRRLDPRARFSLRLSPSLLGRVNSVAGFALDLPINRCSLAAGKRSMRLGPDEWQLSGSPGEAAQIAADIERAIAPMHHALVDIGHARVALSVSGRRAAEAINSGCPLNLGLAAFPAGMATRTLLAKAEIVLARWADAPAFEIECSRSFAAYVRDFLNEAARQLRAEG